MQVIDTYWHSSAFVIDIARGCRSRHHLAGPRLRCRGRRRSGRSFPADPTRRPAEWGSTTSASKRHSEYDVWLCLALGDWRPTSNVRWRAVRPQDGTKPMVVGCSGPPSSSSPICSSVTSAPPVVAVGNLRAACSRTEPRFSRREGLARPGATSGLKCTVLGFRLPSKYLKAQLDRREHLRMGDQ